MLAVMSTKFTNQASESLPEPLTVLLEKASQSVLKMLAERIRDRGYSDVREPHLVMFGNLDCGATHAANIAQRMQISRQATSKMLRELQSRGLVRLESDEKRRNRKMVIMTDVGMQLALDARAELQAIEKMMAAKIGIDAMEALRRGLEKGWGSNPSNTDEMPISHATVAH